jgi:hypothetical protein
MEFSRGVVVGKGEEVATFVTIREDAAVEGLSVEWLVDVSDIVDEKAHCI